MVAVRQLRRSKRPESGPKYDGLGLETGHETRIRQSVDAHWAPPEASVEKSLPTSATFIPTHHRNRQVPSFVWASSRSPLWVNIGTRPGARHRDLPAERIETMG